MKVYILIICLWLAVLGVAVYSIIDLNLANKEYINSHLKIDDK